MVLNFGEDGRLNKISFLPQSASAKCERSSFFLALLDIVEDAFKLFFANDSTKLIIQIERIANFQILCILDASLYKFIIN
jgi:hypothetical protein